MTTIACNKEEICCDLQVTNLQTNNKFKTKTKVFEFKPNELTYPHSGFYMGFAGSVNDMMAVADYFSNPESYDKLPKVSSLRGLILTFNKEIFLFEEYTKWILVNEPFAALGSGEGVALGAMSSGSTPTEAIKIASKIDCYTGMGTKTFKVK